MSLKLNKIELSKEQQISLDKLDLDKYVKGYNIY